MFSCSSRSGPPIGWANASFVLKEDSVWETPRSPNPIFSFFRSELERERDKREREKEGERKRERKRGDSASLCNEGKRILDLGRWGRGCGKEKGEERQKDRKTEKESVFWGWEKVRERVDSVVYLIDSYFEKENSLGGSVFSGILLLGCISKQEQLEVLISVSEGGG